MAGLESPTHILVSFFKFSCFIDHRGAKEVLFLWPAKFHLEGKYSSLVYLHSKSNAMWIQMATSIIELTSFTISFDSSSQLASVELSLAEKQTKLQKKESQLCNSYPNPDEYEDCVRAIITSKLSQQLKCTLPGRY